LGVARYTGNFTPPTGFGPAAGNDLNYDPNWDNVVLLLHMNGTDGSVIFTDDSNSAHTVSPIANAQIDTSQYLFNGSSGYFDGSSDRLDINDSEDWNFGAGDFTVEFFMRIADPSSGSPHLIGQVWGGSGNSFHVGVSAGRYLYYEWTTSGSYQAANSKLSAAAVWTANTWTHVAFVRYGNKWDLYCGGVSVINQTASGTMFNGTSNMQIADNNVIGHLAEIRITKGIARYTSNFTPSVLPFPESSSAPPSQYSSQFYIEMPSSPCVNAIGPVDITENPLCLTTDTPGTYKIRITSWENDPTHGYIPYTDYEVTKEAT
jgi:hypothetical protein